MADRNPSPPHLSAEEIGVIQSDNIGETVFSKKWVLGTLMKLVQSVQMSRESSEESENEDQPSERAEFQGFDDSFEKELCELWDMSMNSDVGIFLQEVETTEVLLDAILRSQIPRVTEICVGILANMACNNDVCVKIMRNKELINIITALLDEPDAPVLVEVTRLIRVGLSNEEVKLHWMKMLQTETMFQNLIFILENSLNVDLLANCSQVVDKVLDTSDTMLATWAELPLVDAVCESLKQMQTRSEQMHIVETLLHILQMVSTTEQGVQGLVSCRSVVPLLCNFVAECGHDEGGIIVGRELSLTECFSVLNVILLADPVKVLTAMEKDTRITKVLMGLLGYSCKIHRKMSHRYSVSEGDGPVLQRSDIMEQKSTTAQTPSSTNKGEPLTINQDNLQCNAEKENRLGQRHLDQLQDIASCSTDKSNDKDEGGLNDTGSYQEGGDVDIHHQYFTVATGFLKDIMGESAKAPKCVSSMLAPHETLLQKIVHYASKTAVYNALVSDLVQATLSIPELGNLHKNLSESFEKAKSKKTHSS